MKNNNKKKNNNLFKNIAILKRGLLKKQNFPNDIIKNNKITNQSKTYSSKLSHKIEIINDINLEDDMNGQEILEKLYREEINKFKIRDSKKEKLNEINLKEENANELYNWNNLLNRKIPFSKRNEININNQKKKSKSFNKIDYNIIDYKKGMNVISQISNDALLNFYQDIYKYRKNISELKPKIKLRKKNNISNLITSERTSLSDKEKMLNILILNEKEKNIFTDHDLKIAAKRKTADVLIKASIVNNKLTENSQENIKNNNDKKNNQNQNKKKKKKGLILSLYDENSPRILKFNEEIHSLSEQNKNKIFFENIFDSKIGDYNNNINRNIFSAKNLKSKSIFFNHLNPENENLKEHSSGTTNISNNKNEVNTNNKNVINFYKNQKRKIRSTFSFRINSKENVREGLFRPMSSSNLFHSEQNERYLFKNKANKKSSSYEEYDEIGFFHSFPRKKTSKVGNSFYDKINKILKYRLLKKFKLNSKKYTKNLITKTINSKYNKNKEQEKINKLIQTFLSENLRTSISGTTDGDILEKQLFSKLEYTNNNKLNKKTNNFFSCSNNYIVNIKRKNKNKFLNELSDKDYFNDMMNEIIFEDQFSHKESTKRIKSVYSHNE